MANEWLSVNGTKGLVISGTPKITRARHVAEIPHEIAPRPALPQLLNARLFSSGKQLPGNFSRKLAPRARQAICERVR